MANLPLRIAALPLTGADKDATTLMSLGGRGWFRARRPEPFAVCIRPSTPLENGAQLLTQIETGFRTAARYSVTTSLNRALLSTHTRLLQENRLSLPQDHRYISAIVAAARSDGLYVARAGPAIVAKVAGGRWVELGERRPPPANGPLELGADGTPTITTEFYGLDTGEIALLVPGVSYLDVSADELGHLSEGIDLRFLSQILERSMAGGSGLAVLRPTPGSEETDERWTMWGSPPPPEPQVESAAVDGAPPPSPEPHRREATVLTSRQSPPPSASPAPAGTSGTREGAAPLVSRTIGLVGWTRVLPVAALAVVLGLAVLLLRGGLPQPGERDRSVAEAGRMVLDAQAEEDPGEAAALLSQAIALLEPQAPRDEAARALLTEARQTKDQVLNVVRIGRISRIPLPARDDFRPAGLWKADGSVFLLDLGGQSLYRLDTASGQLGGLLQPGESFEGQALGRPVTAAWSPPRGTNTEGQLMVVDQTRSLLAVSQTGALVRRWIPPDSAQWQRIGPAAATYENLFLLDTIRAEVWRYPARVPGAVGAIVARASEEPRIGSAVDMATDGNLYFAFPGGEMSKLAPGGGLLPFDGAVPDSPLSAPTALFGQEGLDRVWVLEPSQSRIVELTSGGTYVRQYVLPTEAIRNGVGLHVDPGAGELRLLTPQGVLLVQTE